MYIAIENEMVIGKADTLYILVLTTFPISLCEKGFITFMGKVDTISYNMEQWTEEEAIRDLAAWRMGKILPSNIQIYKAQLV